MMGLLIILCFNPFIPNAPFLQPLTTENYKIEKDREGVNWEQSYDKLVLEDN